MVRAAEDIATARAGGAATTGGGRVGNLDVLRAVAALGVLAGHAYFLGGRKLPVRAEQWYDVPLISTATGVWLFFGLSGYVISKPFIDRLLSGRPLPDIRGYATRRVLRIFPLYWIALTAAIVVVGTAGAKAWQLPIHYALMHNLVPGRQQALLSVAWTLTLEVLFYIAVPLLAVAIHRRARSLRAERLALWVLISWLVSMAFTLVADFYEGPRVGLWLRGSLPATWQMFCPGILLAIAPHLTATRWRRWIADLPASRGALLLAPVLLLAAALLGAASPLRWGVDVYEALTDAARPLFAIGYGIVIAAAIRARPWRVRWALHLGLISYGIYLLHAVVQNALLTGWGRELIPLPQSTPFAYLVHIAFLAGITIPLAMASWRWLERPCIRLAGRLTQRSRARELGGPAEAGRGA